ncbi:aminotransferase class III-fold pyridoxal phosphate-dependent enzyme [Streptomyces albus subsp. chlorinus]|nr:hypothetical protein [Streptomyces albus]NSC19916.1 aminotransferase class III-fold pyridoxal phosphate-dependent enzyme [Streptomyces albus subsp. chlorinus]
MADFCPRAGEVLDRHGILVILDEVATAYGRPGEWSAAPSMPPRTPS